MSGSGHSRPKWAFHVNLDQIKYVGISHYHANHKATTALLFIDPYNDFLSEGGKIWPRVKDIAIAVGLLDNLRAISSAVRRAGIQIFIVPHRDDACCTRAERSDICARYPQHERTDCVVAFDVN